MAKVKLTDPTWVHGAIQPAGTIVEMDDKLAAHFGELQNVPKVKAETPVEKQTKKTTAKSED